MNKRMIATVMLFVTALIWGFAFVAQVLGGDHVGAFTFNAIRFVLGGAVLIPVYLLIERERDMDHAARQTKHKKTALAALPAGLALLTASVLQQYGAAMTRDPGKAGFITGLYTVLTPVFYLIIFQKKSPWSTWVGVILTTVGLYMLCLKEGSGFVFGEGEILLFLGALVWTTHILIVDRFIADVSPLRFSSWQFLVCGVLGMIMAFFTEEISLSGVLNAKWAILYCGLLSVGMGYTFQNLAQKHVPPTQAAIIMSTEAVFAALGGIVWNLAATPEWQVDQEISSVGYVGCVVIFTGIILSQLDFSSRNRKKHEKTEEEV